MLPTPTTFSSCLIRSRFRLFRKYTRSLVTLAIETSCDDTSVAILEKRGVAHTAGITSTNNDSGTPAVRIHFHEKVTANNLKHRGIHPIVSLDSHQENLALLVQRAIGRFRQHVGNAERREESISPTTKPDFISVTRGPGMRSNLSAGLDLAKGLAVAWNIPLVGVNHMQAHALTPRLVSAMNSDPDSPIKPAFPFLSLLVSGGHTMLIHSKSLTDHPTLAETSDIAIGDAIDKIARAVLPGEILATSASTMYGPLLEEFAFPTGPDEYDYSAPATRGEEMARRTMPWGWGLSAPLAETRSGSKSKAMEYSFTGTCSAVDRIVKRADHALSVPERRDLAREAMRVMFEHLASRVVFALKGMAATGTEVSRTSAAEEIGTLVISGGVAANLFLRHLLRAFLDVRGFSKIELAFPPPELCTDNAAMIGWAGMEMYEAGWTSLLSCRAFRKWSLDPQAEDGGILGVRDWQSHKSE